MPLAGILLKDKNAITGTAGTLAFDTPKNNVSFRIAFYGTPASTPTEVRLQFSVDGENFDTLQEVYFNSSYVGNQGSDGFSFLTFGPGSSMPLPVIAIRAILMYVDNNTSALAISAAAA